MGEDYRTTGARFDCLRFFRERERRDILLTIHLSGARIKISRDACGFPAAAVKQDGSSKPGQVFPISFCWVMS